MCDVVKTPPLVAGRLDMADGQMSCRRRVIESEHP